MPGTNWAAGLVNLRMAATAESRIGRMILISLLVAVGGLALVIAFYRGRTSGEQGRGSRQGRQDCHKTEPQGN